MNKKLFYGAVLLTIIISIIYSFTGGQTQEEYAEELAKHRDETDRFMRFSDESPFEPDSIKYEGLNYFPPDINYKITARFIPAENPSIQTLSTNDGKKKQYLSYGTASFELNGQTHSLSILENVEEGELFLAFGDETSAITTYGAGRYLDVTHTGGNSIILDFNKAYNPYCAYNPNYTCPLPPRENLLTVAIEAGEKKYE